MNRRTQRKRRKYRSEEPKNGKWAIKVCLRSWKMKADCVRLTMTNFSFSPKEDEAKF